MRIFTRQIGPGHGCAVLAEIGLAHDGSLALAHAMLDEAAAAGVDAVKFQCHIAPAESTPDEAWRVRPEYPQDASRYGYWERTEFNVEQWAGLRQHCHDRRVGFVASPFSLEAVDLLKKVGVDAWKIPSGETTNTALLKAVGRPAILSTGLAIDLEIVDAATTLKRDFAVLQCTSSYPCPPEAIGLNIMEELERFRVPVGLSDHSGTIYAGLAAATLGAQLLEVHVRPDPPFGPDASSSITFADLARLVQGVRFIADMRPVNKDAMARKLSPMRKLFLNKHKRKAAFSKRLKGPWPHAA